jgi:hypothetical protein
MAVLVVVIMIQGCMYQQLPTQKTLEERFADVTERANSQIAGWVTQYQKHAHEFNQCATTFEERRQVVQDHWVDMAVIVHYYKLYADEDAFKRYEQMEAEYITKIGVLLADFDLCMTTKVGKKKEAP